MPCERRRQLQLPSHHHRRTPEDNGVKFKIFVSVLDDSDIAEQIELSIARSKDNYSAMRGITNEPPGVAKDEVVTVKKQ